MWKELLEIAICMAVEAKARGGDRYARVWVSEAVVVNEWDNYVEFYWRELPQIRG